MKKTFMLILITMLLSLGIVAAQDAPIVARPGEAVNMILLPRIPDSDVLGLVERGAQEAHDELNNPGELQVPRPDNQGDSQIDVAADAASRGDIDAILIASHEGDDLVPTLEDARDSGKVVVTWDYPIPSGNGEDLFISPVDPDEVGQALADMALDILGKRGGKFAILAGSPDSIIEEAWISALETVLDEDSAYAGLDLLEITYGNDDPDESYLQALVLIDQYPDLRLIIAPNLISITEAARAIQDEDLCDQVKISGLGLPVQLERYTMDGCVPEFALWDYIDVGYVTYYASYLLATDAMIAEDGVTFEAGRLGTFTIEEDLTRDAGLRVVVGELAMYDADNVHQAANPRRR